MLSIHCWKQPNYLIPDQLELAVEAIVQAKNIHFFGVGASGIAAIDAQQKFLRIHKASTVSTDLHMGATIMANVDEEDVVVGISFSGSTFEVGRILELAQANGATDDQLDKIRANTDFANFGYPVTYITDKGSEFAKRRNVIKTRPAACDGYSFHVCCF